MSDLIEHGRTGYLARAFEVEDLARGIAWVTEDRLRLNELSARSRQRAEANFCDRLAADRYRGTVRGIGGGVLLNMEEPQTARIEREPITICIDQGEALWKPG